MRFDNIRSQPTAIETLQRALRAGKVHHAYLFSGPRGVGKRMAALALSAALNCSEGRPDEACGTCGACRKIKKGTHPDLLALSIPEGKKIIPIEAVRELGVSLASKPYEGRAKIAIIDPADRLSESAANALLKYNKG